MADHDPEDLTNARKVLVEMRYKWIKAIAASGDTEGAIKGIIQVQHAIDVVDRAIDEFDELDDGDEEEDEDD